MPPFERFRAWQLAHRLTLAVYDVSGSWPSAEGYGLVAQVRRAAVSVAANIAEGMAKRGSREFGRHLDIALRSLAELTYLLRLSLDLKYMKADQYSTLESTRAEAGKVLWGLYSRVRPRQAGPLS
jgi:four helix bundle protein